MKEKQPNLLPQAVLQAKDPERAYLRWTMENDPPKSEDSLILRGLEEGVPW